MKILRSKGQSYTEQDDLSAQGAKLSRGLVLKADKLLTPSGYGKDNPVKPSRLADYVGEDYALILRQTISVLDKVIRKPRSLRGFERQAYIDRARLAGELWDLLRTRCEKDILKLENGEEAFKVFKDTWWWKVHPYGSPEFSRRDPGNDENAKAISKYREQMESRGNAHLKTCEDFNGRWYTALWRTSTSGQPDYRATAEAIFRHLFDQELEISGREKTLKYQDRPPTGKGLIEARGLGMAKSANDPRIGKDPEKTRQWDSVTEDMYFAEDVAAKIFVAVMDDDDRPKFFNASRFGEILYKHFGDLRQADKDADTLKRLWALHNRVRQFYQKLAKSERFRRAWSEGVTGKLKEIVPRDKEALLAVIDAKKRNADLGELIRLGKLIAHASDLPHDTKEMQRVFENRMEYLVTSAGQSEIKRNEAFTRVWRTAVGLSLRTLKAWADPNDKVRSGSDDDLTSADVAMAAVRDLYKEEYFRGHAPLIFGDKSFDYREARTSRVSLFINSDERVNKEMLWAMLRLGGEIRHRINHFNTMQRVLDVVTGGIVTSLRPERDPIAAMRGGNPRRGNEVHVNALAAFKKLLDFDLFVQKQIVADELNRIQVTRYLTNSELSVILDQLSPAWGQIDIILPKFMSMLKRAKKLAEGSPDIGADPLITPFKTLNLEALSKATQGPNHCKVGLLRQLYANGFQTWLAAQQKNERFVPEAIRNIGIKKLTRAEEANKAAHRLYAKASTLADDLGVASMKSLDDLFGALSSWIMGEERLNRSYSTDRQKQRDTTSPIEEFKQDLIAHMFGSYLNDQKLDWIWQIEDPSDPTEPLCKLTSDDIDMPAFDTEPWHTQFYAWLYLVPNSEVALLRHQFRKTRILEGKGARAAGSNVKDVEDQRTNAAFQEPPNVLTAKLGDMDRLMGLYTAVQTAGFSGREHISGLGIGSLMYENPDQFNAVYSDDMETHHLSVPGTRSGLRQVLRFGHLAVLKRILEKHPVTSQEVETFGKLRTGEITDCLGRKSTLHKAIVDLAEQRKPNETLIKTKCAEYRKAATQAALYNFAINGARLTEHARLHHLMMRVVTRLTDFTLMWERDHHYVFLARLYKEFQENNSGFELMADGRTIGIKLNGTIKERLERDFLPLWDQQRGFVADRAQSALLRLEDRDEFNRHFVELPYENPKDVDAATQAQARGGNPRKSMYRRGKPQIRNDFAHFNVIAAKRNRINLSYLTNVVRSLLSYDRKLKNAVSKAIADILLDEGLVIKWELYQDRLRRPTITPRLETHLAMVRPIGEEAMKFYLPQTSVRFTSMVKALFDFESGGYRLAVMGGDGEMHRNGEMRYPQALYDNEFGDAIAQEMFVALPALPQE